MPLLQIRVVVHVDGGVVQRVMTPDDPAAVLVILADYDWEGIDGDDIPVNYYPVDPISEEEYKEYVNDVGQTLDLLTGVTMEEECQPTKTMTLS